MMNDSLKPLLERAELLLNRLEHFFPPAPSSPDWENVRACRWRKRQQYGELQAVYHPHDIRLADLQGIDAQKALINRNTQQFIRHCPANNVLLWGSRGTGKSSLIKALLNEYATQGLRLIEVDKQDLIDLPDIVDNLYNRSERFIIFSDDLSFEKEDASYKALKSVLDGSISAPPRNVLIYATSNRRHLLPEYMKENLEATYTPEGEIHQGEAVEEKISLSERFGLWLSFYPFNQDEYLAIVRYWLVQLGATDLENPEMRKMALQWALTRGSRSGRSAWQFARDWAGQQGIIEK
ncbi:putative ATPase (AAA+ superfamily) [Beggiatoa alba B18LD]|uniref:Putative ATPase (AAA+ superfamily) n=1 Tax=Beggiatoa alba B18LD TaxID=395493 RepID=I3CC52_9GAMM|nr:ATP-binding protein [Beggiatoa alba]EIJ41195.1 putative ATPase (AAA+ superfamily) [Beggiatoa alba B18LD]